MLPYWIKNIKNIKNIETSKDVKESDYLNSFSKLMAYAGIADRTISFNFHRFKNPRENINDLIIENKKLYSLSDAEIDKYREAVESICGNKSSISKIDIDRGGFSLEVAKELGMNYLEGNYIIISKKQKDCDVLRRNMSFSTNISEIERLFIDNSIDQILLGEALIGISNFNEIFNIIVNNPESIFNIEINFDTPIKAISKLKKIKEVEELIILNNNKIKDIKFLENILQNIEDIIQKHGSLNRVKDKEIILRSTVDILKLRLDKIDIYCIKAEKPIFIYFYSDNYSENSNNCNKINYRIDIKAKSKGSIFLNGNNIVETINALIDFGIICYSPYLGLERVVNMILRNRREKLSKLSKENPRSEDIKKLFLEKRLDQDIPENASNLLLDIQLLVKNERSKMFFFNLGKNKIYMTYPLIQNQILYEILSRMENDEIKSSYMDTDKFFQIISNISEEELFEFIKKILNSLEFKEENNPIVNEWLKDNKPDLCQRLGINFIINNRYK